MENMITVIGALAMIIICVAFGYMIAKKGANATCKNGYGENLEEIEIEIKTIDGKAPRFDKLPKSVQMAVGSKERYDDAIKMANIRRLDKNNA